MTRGVYEQVKKEYAKIHLVVSEPLVSITRLQFWCVALTQTIEVETIQMRPPRRTIGARVWSGLHVRADGYPGFSKAYG